MLIRATIPFAGDHTTREVFALLPGAPNPRTRYVFCTDGASVARLAAGLEDKISQNQIGLIGVANSPLHRGEEYVIGRDADRFERHERFFVEVVRDWLESHAGFSLAKENSAVFGYSRGGAFAVSMGIRHADLFGGVIALSIAGRPVRIDLAPPLPLALSESRFYLAAGESEPGSIKTYTKRLATWIGHEGGDAVCRFSPGGHEPSVWKTEFERGIDWLWADEDESSTVRPGGLTFK